MNEGEVSTYFTFVNLIPDHLTKLWVHILHKLGSRVTPPSSILKLLVFVRYSRTIVTYFITYPRLSLILTCSFLSSSVQRPRLEDIYRFTGVLFRRVLCRDQHVRLWSTTRQDSTLTTCHKEIIIDSPMSSILKSDRRWEVSDGD